MKRSRQKGSGVLFRDFSKKTPTRCPKKHISIFASELQFRNIFGPYFDLWHKKRISLGIKQRAIFPKEFKSKLPEDLNKVLKNLNELLE